MSAKQQTVTSANLDNFAIVLCEPRHPENIGASARCCKNMGISQLIVVKPENPDRERMAKLATHEAVDILENMQTFDTLQDALSSFNYVVGTTARTGRQRRSTSKIREIAADIACLSHQNRIAIVFGSENWGLKSDAIALCNTVVTIPTADFSSINLAQSVMIICYEIFTASRTSTPSDIVSKLANVAELEGMYGHIRELFAEIGFLNPENPEYWLLNTRRLFSRIRLTSLEVRVIRGFCRKALWKLKKLT